jgi:hypothetical protein
VKVKHVAQLLRDSYDAADRNSGGERA